MSDALKVVKYSISDVILSLPFPIPLYFPLSAFRFLLFAFSLLFCVQVNNSLVALNLEENGIGDWGATAIADAMAVNKSITYLNLCSNGIGVCSTKIYRFFTYLLFI